MYVKRLAVSRLDNIETREKMIRSNISETEKHLNDLRNDLNELAKEKTALENFIKDEPKVIF